MLKASAEVSWREPEISHLVLELDQIAVVIFLCLRTRLVPHLGTLPPHAIPSSDRARRNGDMLAHYLE